MYSTGNASTSGFGHPNLWIPAPAWLVKLILMVWCDVKWRKDMQRPKAEALNTVSPPTGIRYNNQRFTLHGLPSNGRLKVLFWQPWPSHAETTMYPGCATQRNLQVPTRRCQNPPSLCAWLQFARLVLWFLRIREDTGHVAFVVEAGRGVMQNQTAAASKSFKIKVHFRLTCGKGCSTRDHAGLEARFLWDSTTSSSLLTMGPDYEVHPYS